MKSLPSWVIVGLYHYALTFIGCIVDGNAKVYELCRKSLNDLQPVFMLFLIRALMASLIISLMVIF